MDADYSLIQRLADNAVCTNATPKQLIQNVINALQQNSVETNLHLSIINGYLSQNSNVEAKLLLVAGVAHLNLKTHLCDLVELEKLAKNTSGLLRASHKSLMFCLETLKKTLKDPRICARTRLQCLMEILIRTNRSPYPINKPVEELCKKTVRFLSEETRNSLFLLNMGAIKKSVLSEVPCVLLAELLKYVTNKTLFDNIPVLLVYIVHGFCSNVGGVQRSHIYKVLVERLDFSEWEVRVFAPFVQLYKEFHSNDCFMESVKSYFIPVTVLKYKENFYVACRRSMSNTTICASGLLYLTRRGLCSPYKYTDDIAVFCEQESVASTGFELLCNLSNINDFVERIFNFLYEYRWLEEREKIIGCLKRVVGDANFCESLFYFSLAMVNSTSRTLADFGCDLMRVVCERRYSGMILDVYMKNCAVSANFVGCDFDKEDLMVAARKYEDYRWSRNICHLTKASYLFYNCAKTGGCDLNDFMRVVKEKLNTIDERSFQDGSTLFYIKTLKLLYEHGIVVEDILGTLSQTISTLLTNTNINTISERKLYESLLSDILVCMQLHNNKQTLLLNSCFQTIQLSNYKQPVTTASLILQKTCPLESTLTDKCFEGLTTNNTNMSTIRCSAEYRLVLESICVANPQTTLEIFNRLLTILKNRNVSEYCTEAALHTTDALLANKKLQNVTRSYIEDVVEIILESDWLCSFRTRNAAIQVWRTIVKTFKGAPLDYVFLQYNRLPYIFYRILKKNLNEKTLLILSTFIECQQGVHLLKPNLANILNPFTVLFVHLILNETGYCGRFAVAAYAAQCSPDTIIFVLHDLAAFLVLQGDGYRIGVLANIVFLVRALVQKYLVYYGEIGPLVKILYVCSNCVRGLNKLLVHDGGLYQNFERDGESPIGLQIFWLSIISQKNEIGSDTLTTLIVKAINLQTQCQYLLQSYVQTIFFLYEKAPPHNKFTLFNLIDTCRNYTLHQFSIFSLLFAHGTDLPSAIQKQLLNKLFQHYRTIINVEDPENLSLFASTLPYVYKCAKTSKQKLIVFKLAIIFMVNGDTDEEFCKFIATIDNSKLTNLMCSVKKFLCYDNLLHHLQCADLVFEFLVETTVYISRVKSEDVTSFYSIDTESQSLAVSAVKQMLYNCFKSCIQKTK